MYFYPALKRFENLKMKYILCVWKAYLGVQVLRAVQVSHLFLEGLVFRVSGMLTWQLVIWSVIQTEPSSLHLLKQKQKQTNSIRYLSILNTVNTVQSTISKLADSYKPLHCHSFNVNSGTVVSQTQKYFISLWYSTARKMYTMYNRANSSLTGWFQLWKWWGTGVNLHYNRAKKDLLYWGKSFGAAILDLLALGPRNEQCSRTLIFLHFPASFLPLEKATSFWTSALCKLRNLWLLPKAMCRSMSSSHNFGFRNEGQSLFFILA